MQHDDQRLAVLRSMFLLTIHTVAPEVLDDLKAHPDDVEGWAQRWHLGEPWIIEYARERLEWACPPDLPLELVWGVGLGTAVYLPEPITFTIEWNPQAPPGLAPVPKEGTTGVVRVGGPSSEAAWREAHKAWSKYAEETRQRFEEAGFRPASTRGGTNAPLWDRLSWIVRRVIKRDSWATIAKDAELHRTTIRYHVEQLAKKLPLQL